MANSDRRIERLDEFFLFITSVLGLFFSWLYTLLGYREIVYGFLPLLIIGLVIPIYIGYVRGAILLDTLEERVRGWIYFLYGVIFYLIFSILFAVNKLLLILNIEFEPFSGLLFLAGNVLLGFFLGGGKLYRWFCGNIFKAFNHKMTELTHKIYDDTSSNARWTTIYLYISFTLSLSDNLDVSLVSIMAFFISVGVILFIFSERNIRKWVSLVRFSDFIEVESKSSMPYISPRVGKILMWLSIIDLAVLLLSMKWLPLLANIGLTIIASICMILFTFSTATTYTPSRKKDIPKHVATELTTLINRITGKKEVPEHTQKRLVKLLDHITKNKKVPKPIKRVSAKLLDQLTNIHA